MDPEASITRITSAGFRLPAVVVLFSGEKGAASAMSPLRSSCRLDRDPLLLPRPISERPAQENTFAEMATLPSDRNWAFPAKSLDAEVVLQRLRSAAESRGWSAVHPELLTAFSVWAWS